jgi:hypothetical protein
VYLEPDTNPDKYDSTKCAGHWVGVINSVFNKAKGISCAFDMYWAYRKTDLRKEGLCVSCLLRLDCCVQCGPKCRGMSKHPMN